MGVDIHTYLCKYDPEDNLWHELKLYRKNGEEFKEVPIFDGRNSELFEILQNDNFIYNIGDFPSTVIAPLSLEPGFRDRVDQDQKYCYGFSEVLLSDMKYFAKDYPTIPDYEVEPDEWNSQPRKKNPVKGFYETCVDYASFADAWFDFTPLSRYKLLYWFDH